MTTQRHATRTSARLSGSTAARTSNRATGTTIMGLLTAAAAVIALCEVIALGAFAHVPLWPPVSGILTWTGMWLTLVLIRRSSKDRHPQHVSPLVMFAGVYFLTGTLGPALWLLSPVDPPGTVGGEESALVYVVITFVSFAVTVLVGCLNPSRPTTRHAALDSRPGSASRVPGAPLLIALGLAGMIIRFPSIDSLANYFSADYEEVARRAEGAIGYLGSILRPLLPAGLFVWWLNNRNVLRGSVLFVATIVTMGSFSLNRGYVIVPLVAFGIAYHAKVRRIPTSVVVAGVSALAIAFVVTGALRTTTLNSQGGKYDVTNPLDAGLGKNLAQTIQLYAQPPLQTSVVVDAGRPSTGGGRTSVSSVMAPLPGVPTELREHTGTREYNRIIYGKSAPADQILPSHLEAWWLGGLAGLLAWAVASGLMMRWLDRRLVETSTMTATLVLAVASLWVAQLQIVSITVLVQSTLYMGPAALALLLLTRKLRIR